MAKNKIWQKMAEALDRSSEDRKQGLRLFREYSRWGTLRISLSEALALPAGTVADFYQRLSLMHSSTSPVSQKWDERWLRDSDFQFLDMEKGSSYFRVLMTLPRFRSQSIILYPLTQNDPSRPLYPQSHSHLEKRFSDPLLEERGFSVEEQLQFLISAIHLCGKRAGYYVSTLIDPDSAVIFRKPEFFSWKKEGESLGSRDIIKENLAAKDIARHIKELVQENYRQKGGYDYPELRGIVKNAGYSLETHREDAVTFDFTNSDALEYFMGIFGQLQCVHGLDFFYLDFPDDMDKDLAAQVYRTIKQKAPCKRYTAWMLQYGNELKTEEELQPVVSVVPREDIILDEKGIDRWFRELGEIFDKNSSLNKPVSRGFVLDRDRYQADQDTLRHLFLVRFTGAGLFRTPLLLKNDMADITRHMEDIFQRHRHVLKMGHLLKFFSSRNYAWWIMGWKGNLLVSLMSLLQEPGKLENQEPGENHDSIHIDYKDVTRGNKTLTVLDYDFSSSKGSLFLSAGCTLLVTDLKPGSFRLFSLQ